VCDRTRLRFEDRLACTCPPALRAAVTQGAASKMQSPSEYMRRALYAAVTADGILQTKGNK
jgi:hypothetical protein